MRIALTEAGHQVLIARDVAAGMEAVHFERFEVIVCDLLFPDGNGYEIIRAIRKKGALVFALAVSALPREVCEAEAIAAGFDRFLPKPFLPWMLVAQLASLESDEAG
jgi:DNA-binding response OmpR family regulator